MATSEAGAPQGLTVERLIGFGTQHLMWPLAFAGEVLAGKEPSAQALQLLEAITDPEQMTPELGAFRGSTPRARMIFAAALEAADLTKTVRHVAGYPVPCVKPADACHWGSRGALGELKPAALDSCEARDRIGYGFNHPRRMAHFQEMHLKARGVLPEVMRKPLELVYVPIPGPPCRAATADDRGEGTPEREQLIDNEQTPTQQSAPREAAHGADASDGPTVADDFHEATYCGETFHFSDRQALCVKALWEARPRPLSERRVRELAGSHEDSLSKVFRVRKGNRHEQHSAWGKLIVQDRPGFYRIV